MVARGSAHPHIHARGRGRAEAAQSALQSPAGARPACAVHTGAAYRPPMCMCIYMHGSSGPRPLPVSSKHIEHPLKYIAHRPPAPALDRRAARRRRRRGHRRGARRRHASAWSLRLVEWPNKRHFWALHRTPLGLAPHTPSCTTVRLYYNTHLCRPRTDGKPSYELALHTGTADLATKRLTS